MFFNRHATKMTPVLYKKVLFLLHKSLVDIRRFAFNGDFGLPVNHTLISDIADVFEIVPAWINQDFEYFDTFRGELVRLEKKHKNCGLHYLYFLDMDEHEFLKRYSKW